MYIKTYQSVKFNLWASKYTRNIMKKLQFDWFEIFKIQWKKDYEYEAVGLGFVWKSHHLKA